MQMVTHAYSATDGGAGIDGSGGWKNERKEEMVLCIAGEGRCTKMWNRA